MKKCLLQLLSVILILVLLGQAVYADVVPPGPSPETLGTMAVVVVIGLGCLVAVVVLVAAVAIIAIKRKHAAAETTPVDQ